MGSKTDWICNKEGCSGKTGLVAGGVSRGFVKKIQTRICNSCRNIRDYPISLVSDPSWLTFTSEELAQHSNPNPVCSACGGETIAWDRSCPVCGEQMSRGGNLVFFG